MAYCGTTPIPKVAGSGASSGKFCAASSKGKQKKRIETIFKFIILFIM
jgi:hypothetical protein